MPPKPPPPPPRPSTTDTYRRTPTGGWILVRHRSKRMIEPGLVAVNK
jgi:hypothetical protein